jgi:hypothetical protein
MGSVRLIANTGAAMQPGNQTHAYVFVLVEYNQSSHRPDAATAASCYIETQECQAHLYLKSEVDRCGGLDLVDCAGGVTARESLYSSTGVITDYTDRHRQWASEHPETDLEPEDVQVAVDSDEAAESVILEVVNCAAKDGIQVERVTAIYQDGTDTIAAGERIEYSVVRADEGTFLVPIG